MKIDESDSGIEVAIAIAVVVSTVDGEYNG